MQEVTGSLIPDVFDKLFTLDKKKDVEKYCKSIQISMVDLFQLIMVWQNLGLGYSMKFRDFQAPIEFGSADIDKIVDGMSGKGPQPLSDDGKKVLRKTDEMFRERKYRVVHMFACVPKWHCFFFDQHDAFPDVTRPPHWKEGGHIHYLSYLTTSLDISEIWKLFDTRDAKLPKSIHIKFTGMPYEY